MWAPGQVFQESRSAYSAEGVRGLLVESQRKRRPYERCIEDLHLNTLSVRCGRVEDVARTEEFRESFVFAFSRGYAGLYVVWKTALALGRAGAFCCVLQ
jgi:16S rRNA G527 N7-methylase RsmG